MQTGLQAYVMSPRARLILIQIGLAILGLVLVFQLYSLLRLPIRLALHSHVPAAAKVAVAFLTELVMEKRIWIGILAILAALYPVWRLKLRHHQIFPAEPSDNGIRAGNAKVFDARSITLMYEELLEQLRTIESIKEDTLASAIGTRQGGRSTNLQVGLNSTASGTEKEAEKPAPIEPPVGTMVSERAADLLTDQMNLAFQAFNLRLTLERSISDRVFDFENADTRRQAVIGIPVSIDPPSFAAGCSARIEVRFTINDQAPSLVGLLPQEQTYNMLGVDSRSFHAKPPIKSYGIDNLQVVAREAKQEQHRHADVVACELDPGTEKKLVVAWQFRPPQGARTVAAGLKPVVAVLSLPVADDSAVARLNVETRTSWHAWKSGDQLSATRSTWRALFSDRKTRTEWSSPQLIEIPASEHVDSALGPVIENICWLKVGPTQAAVLIDGKRFFTGTRVVLGGIELATPKDGLTIKSEQAMQLIVPFDALLREGVLNGRYGQSIPLGRDVGNPPQLAGVTIKPTPDRAAFNVSLVIEPRPGVAFTLKLFHELPLPILLVNKKIVNGTFFFSEPVVDQGNIQKAILSVIIPVADLPSLTAEFALHWPFFNHWTLITHSFDSAVNVRVFRSPLKGGRVRLQFAGTDFDSKRTVILLDRSYTGNELLFPNPARMNLIAIEVEEGVLSRYKQVLLCIGPGEPIALEIPQHPGPSFALTSVSVQKLTVKTAAVLEFSGTGLTLVEKARFDQETMLDTFASPDGAIIIVRFTEESTETTGTKKLIFVGRDGHEAEVLVEVCAAKAA